MILLTQIKQDNSEHPMLIKKDNFLEANSDQGVVWVKYFDPSTSNYRSMKVRETLTELAKQ